MKMRAAILKLIELYKNGKHEPSTAKCPLCLATRDKKYGSEKCEKCPNSVHAFYDGGLGCVHRSDKIWSLHWNNEAHSLVEYWTDVHALMVEKKRDVVTDEIKEGILEITKKYVD